MTSGMKSLGWDRLRFLLIYLFKFYFGKNTTSAVTRDNGAHNHNIGYKNNQHQFHREAMTVLQDILKHTDVGAQEWIEGVSTEGCEAAKTEFLWCQELIMGAPSGGFGF